MLCLTLITIRCGVVANIIVSHTIARGSIPRIGNPFFYDRNVVKLLGMHSRPNNPHSPVNVFFVLWGPSGAKFPVLCGRIHSRIESSGVKWAPRTSVNDTLNAGVPVSPLSVRLYKSNCLAVFPCVTWSTIRTQPELSSLSQAHTGPFDPSTM